MFILCLILQKSCTSQLPALHFSPSVSQGFHQYTASLIGMKIDPFMVSLLPAQLMIDNTTFLNSLKPNETHFNTGILLLLNIVNFLCMVLLLIPAVYDFFFHVLHCYQYLSPLLIVIIVWFITITSVSRYFFQPHWRTYHPIVLNNLVPFQTIFHSIVNPNKRILTIHNSIIHNIEL